MRTVHKYTLLVICVVLAIGATVVGALFGAGVLPVSSSSDFSFRRVTGGYEVSGYKGSNSIVTVPGSYNGSKVVGIGEAAFSNSDASEKIREVRLPNSIVYIEKLAFSGMLFERMTLPSNVERVGDEAFKDCVNLYFFSFVDNKSALIDIGRDAFKNTKFLNNYFDFSLETQLVISGCLIATKNIAFGNYTLPKDVQVIAADAYASASLLSGTFSVSSGSELRAISRFAFDGIPKIGAYDFSNALNLKFIGDGAFDNNIDLEILNFGQSAIVFGTHVFTGCEKLNTLSISADCQNVYQAFRNLFSEINAPAFKLVITNGSVKQAWGSVFASTVTELVISLDVESMHSSAIRSFSKMTTLEIPARIASGLPATQSAINNSKLELLSLTGNGGAADKYEAGLNNVRFEGVESLVVAGVTSISDYAFLGYTDLEEVWFGESGFDTDEIEFFGMSVFGNHTSNIAPWFSNTIDLFVNGSIFEASVNEWIIGSTLLCIRGTAVTSALEINPKVDTLNYNFIAGSSDVVSSVLIHPNIKRIAERAFENQGALEKIAFMLNDRQTHGLVFAGEEAFAGTALLEVVTLENLGENTWGNEGRSSLVLEDIEEFGANVFPASYLSILGTDKVFGSTVLLFVDTATASEVVIASGIRVVAAEAVASGGLAAAQEIIVIPSSVVFIGRRAFWGLTNLQEIFMDSSVVLGEEAFR